MREASELELRIGGFPQRSLRPEGQAPSFGASGTLVPERTYRFKRSSTKGT